MLKFPVDLPSSCGRTLEFPTKWYRDLALLCFLRSCCHFFFILTGDPPVLGHCPFQAAFPQLVAKVKSEPNIDIDRGTCKDLIWGPRRTREPYFLKNKKRAYNVGSEHGFPHLTTLSSLEVESLLFSFLNISDKRVLPIYTIQ